MKSASSFSSASSLATVVFFLSSFAAWAQEAAPSDEKNLRDKPLDIGTLDYLDKGYGSAYDLIEDRNEYESKEDVPPGDLLRYQLDDVSAWLNKNTGEVVFADPTDPANYYSLTLKELTPKLYQFQFKEEVLHLRHGDSGTQEIVIPIEIPGITPTGTPYEFTYTYNPADVKTSRAENATETLEGVYKDFTNRAVVNDEKSSGSILIKADFINNSGSGNPHSGKGGAIQNLTSVTIDSVTGCFIGNNSELEGGAIWNWGNGEGKAGISVGTISGVFINNYVSSNNASPHRGGAIFNANYATIGEIRGAFIGNHIYGLSSSAANDTNVGGAIYNAEGGKIDAIYADFIGNYITGKGHGGAIYNGGGGSVGNTDPSSVIKSIVGDFIANYIETTDQYEAYGGAISNQAIVKGGYAGGALIELIQGDFIQNYTQNFVETAGGGALYNNRQARVNKIEGNFIRNHTISHAAKAKDNVGNTYLASGGAIMNFHALDKGYDISNPDYCSTIDEIDGNFYHNYAQATDAAVAQGGAISNHDGGSYIGTITGDFIGNHVDAVNNFARGGAVFTDDNSIIKKISGNFYNNYAKSQYERANGGAIRNGGAMDTILNAVFEGNYAESSYLADPDRYMSRFIATPETRAELWYNGELHRNVGNIYYQIGAFGGAIFNESTLTITADTAPDGKEGSGIVFFNGNFVRNMTAAGFVERDEAIYGRDGSKITLNALNNGAIFFNDRIRGEQLYALVGDNDRVIAILSNANVNDIAKHADELKETFKGIGEYKRVEQVGEGFLMMLTGDNTNSSVVFAAPVSYASLTLENISLVLHVEYESDVEEDLKRSYLADDLLQRYGDDYKVSYILRASLLDAQSGQIALQDGMTTEYFFGSLNTNGAASLTGLMEIPQDYTEKNVLFNIDVNLDRGVSDIFTVFGVKASKDDEDWKPVNWGSDRKSVSTGYVTIAPTFLLEGNSYTYENEVLREKMFTIQVINFVVMEGLQGSPVTDDDYYAQFRDPNTDIIQLTELPDNVEWARSHMRSDEVLSKGLWLSTTKTYHDSFSIIGWRDPLAAWAELLPDDEHGGWEKSENGEKVYTLLPHAYVMLTRNTVDKTTATNYDPATATEVAAVQGTDDWAIVGGSDSVLDLAGHNLLSVVVKGQTALMQNFRLMGVQGQSMLNEGELTLDTMAMDNELILHNESKLTLTGATAVTYTITSAEPNREMVIENASGVSEKTIVSIENTVENQNIVQRGEGARDKDDFTTDTILRVTEAPDAQSALSRAAADANQKNPAVTKAFEEFRNNSLDLQGGRFNLLGIMPADVLLRLRTLSMNGGTLMVERSQVDLEKKQMGGIRADQATAASGEIYLAGMQLLNDSKETVTHVQFVNEEVGDLVKDNGIRNSRMKGSVHYYDVTYNDTEKTDSLGQTGRNGWYTFTLLPDVVVPEVQVPAVAQLGGYASMMQVYEYAFEHADLFSSTMASTRRERYEGGTIVTPVKGYKEAPMPAALCPTDKAGLQRALWLRPYATYEKLPLDNGPKVDTNLYGALFGYDTALREHRGGWAEATSVYGTYLGATKRYEGIRSRENGLGIGATETFYKGAFYTAVTASVSTSFGSTSTDYGHEKYHMLMGGIASRTGYNMTPGSCRYVLQPTLLMSYTMVNVSDYTNASGVRMDSSPLQVFQLHPYLKAIVHTHSGWNPYLTAGYVHNFMGKTNVRANGEKIPELSIDPYVEYSLGFQKTWSDKYTIYGQATGRHGGRSGAEVSTGIRWCW